MDGKLKNAKQELYRDLYLFCAFTGLSFSDMRSLTEENIRTYFDEHEWININRQKTGVVSNIRLLDIANRIIGKYRGPVSYTHLDVYKRQRQYGGIRSNQTDVPFGTRKK